MAARPSSSLFRRPWSQAFLIKTNRFPVEAIGIHWQPGLRPPFSDDPGARFPTALKPRLSYSNQSIPFRTHANPLVARLHFQAKLLPPTRLSTLKPSISYQNQSIPFRSDWNALAARPSSSLFPTTLEPGGSYKKKQ